MSLNGEMLGNGGPRMWRGPDVPENSLRGVSVRDPGREWSSYGETSWRHSVLFSGHIQD